MSTKKSLKPSPKKRKPPKRGRSNDRSATSWLRLPNDEPDKQHVTTKESASNRTMMYMLEPEQESDLWLVRLAEFYVRLDEPAFQTEVEQIVFEATGIPCTVEQSMIMRHPPGHVHVNKLKKYGLAAIRHVGMLSDNRTKVVKIPLNRKRR